ncbi:MAG: DUF445 family protein, partial [Clostridiales bacterium]|jgi:uncharacterized membrane protein YheB (UPF0754 family)|nr:DUF445 family protein [Clostridiales bacterium]
MLFRPHTEKRIFGWRVPMTPGLIPKEKARLANKIGETLAKNVLTETELTAAVSSPEVMGKLTAMLDSFLKDLSAGGYDEQIDALLDKAAEKVCQMLSEKSGLTAGFLSGVYDKLKEQLLTKGSEYLRGEAFAQAAAGFIQGIMDKLAGNTEAIGSYLPENLTGDIPRFIDEKLPGAVEFLKILPERYPDIDDRLNELVQRVAEENFGAFLGVFIRYDHIYGKIKTSLFKYLDDPENRAFITERITEWAVGALNKTVAELFAKLPESIRGGAADSAAALLKRGLDGDALEKLITGIEDKVKDFSLLELLGRFTDDIPGMVKSVLKSITGAFITNLNGDNTEQLREAAIRLIQRITEKGGAYVITSMRFDTLIENKINAFGVQEAEDLIVSVVDRELKSITWLGGVLGLIIGFVPLITKAIGVG